MGVILSNAKDLAVCLVRIFSDMREILHFVLDDTS